MKKIMAAFGFVFLALSAHAENLYLQDALFEIEGGLKQVVGYDSLLCMDVDSYAQMPKPLTRDEILVLVEKRGSKLIDYSSHSITEAEKSVRHVFGLTMKEYPVKNPNWLDEVERSVRRATAFLRMSPEVTLTDVTAESHEYLPIHSLYVQAQDAKGMWWAAKYSLKMSNEECEQ